MQHDTKMLLGLLGALTIGCDGAPLEDSADSATEFRAVANPSNPGPLPTCVSNWNHGGVEGEVHFPSLNACVNTLDAPLVVLLHGNGYSYTGYDFLLAHLASWGYIAVSVNVLAPFPDDHAQPTAEALAYLDAFQTSWPMAAHIETDSLALIGHSRGGGTVRHLADALAGDPTWTVRAVVVMAGTNADELDVDADMTDGLLVMHGAKDTDVPAYKGVRLHDRSGSEASLPLGGNGLDKAFKLLENGTHKGFAGQADPGQPNQGNVVRGYVLAFLRGRIEGDDDVYDEYIVGNAIPGGWPNRVIASYSDGVLRKVVDNGEDGSWSLSTIGGSVKVSHAEVAAIDLEADVASEHSTRALRMRATSAGGSATWSIPLGQGNVDLYDNLDFRVLIDGASTSTNLFVSVQRGGFWSPALTVSNYTEIPYRVTGPIAGSELDVMASVRIPLSDFGGSGDVQAIRLSAQGDAVNRWFTLDNLEFADGGLVGL